MFYVILGLGVLFLVLLGFVQVVKWLLKIDPGIQSKASESTDRSVPLSRQEKLDIVREVMGDRMPVDLQQELNRWQIVGHAGVPNPEAHTDSPLDPAAAVETPPTTVDETRPGIEPDASVQPQAAEIEASEPGPEEAVEEDTPPPISHEPPTPADLGPALGSFLSFENIVFLLAAVLFVGGGIYFAATTWGRVPQVWQPVFLAAVTCVFGMVLLGSGWFIQNRLELTTPARVLATVASIFAVVCAIINVTASNATPMSTVVGLVVASTLAFAAVQTFEHFSSNHGVRTGVFVGAVAVFAAGRFAADLVGPAALAAVLCIAGLMATTCLLRRDAKATAQDLVLAAAIPLGALVVSIPNALSFAYALPTLATLVFIGRPLHHGHFRASEILVFAVAAGPAALALPGLESETTVFMVVGLIALIGCLQLTARAADDPGSRPPPKALVWVGTVLWTLLACTWISGEFSPYSLFTDESAPRGVFPMIGAVVFPALTLWRTHRWRGTDDPRSLAAEAALWVIAAFAMGEAQDFVHDHHWIEAAAAGGIAAMMLWWNRLHPNTARAIGAYILVLVAAAIVTHAINPSLVLLVTVLTALAVQVVGGRGGLILTTLVTPLLVIALVAEHSAQAWVLGAIVAAHAAGQLRWAKVRECPRALWPAPLNLLFAWSIFMLYRPKGGSPWVHNDHTLLVLSAGLVAGAAWLAIQRGPRFLLHQVSIIALVLAGFGFALEMSWWIPLADDLLSPALASVVALLCLPLAARALDDAENGRRTWHWIIAMVGVPMAVAIMGRSPSLWPGAIAAAGAAATLLWFSRRRASPVAAGVGLVEGLIALWWALVAVAIYYSTGKRSPYHVLPVLTLFTGAYTLAVVMFGERISAAGPRLIKGFTTCTVTLIAILGWVSMTQVAHPDGLHIGLVIAHLFALAGLCWFIAIVLKQNWAIYLGHAAITGIYPFLRMRTDWLDGLAEFDAVMAAAAAFLLIGLSKVLGNTESKIGAKETGFSALLLPLIIPITMNWNGELGDSIGLTMATGLYVLQARTLKDGRLATVAAVFINLMLIPLALRAGFHGPIAWGLPMGAAILVLVRLYPTLFGSQTSALRTVGAVMMLGATAWESFSFTSPWPALVTALLSIAGVLLGLVWRQRAYLYTGFVFLIIDLLANLTHWAMQTRFMGAFISIACAVVLFSLGVVVSRHKEALLLRYAEIKDWEW